MSDIDYDRLKFPRGYLITPRALTIKEPVPAFWLHHVVAGLDIRLHPNADYYQFTNADGIEWLMFGHAYDPWRMVHEESRILKDLDSAHLSSDGAFLDALDRLSGRFVLFRIHPDGTGMALQDAVGLKNLYYTTTSEGPSFSSHSQLLADTLGLNRDPVIDRIVSSFMYGIGIRHLPGLRSPFLGMSMLSANTRLRLPNLKVERFFPRCPHPESDDHPATARIIGDVFRASFDCLVRKRRLAVSLSLGTDSRVTLAASRTHAADIHYFSYISDKAEEKDAIGAHEMCARLGLDHTIYRVPIVEMDYLDDSPLSAILNHNAAYIRNPTVTERAKLHYLVEHFPVGLMEVKTPVSEIGRAIYCKKLGVTRLPCKLTPRHMSNLYKRNLFERSVLHEMDRAFEDYIHITSFGKDFHNYEQHDMFYWEHRNTAWASLANQDHDLLHDMTVIFNNRKILELLLAPSRQDRIDDSLHHAIVRYLWPEALNTPLSNLSTPKKVLRKLAERIFFNLNRF